MIHQLISTIKQFPVHLFRIIWRTDLYTQHKINLSQSNLGFGRDPTYYKDWYLEFATIVSHIKWSKRQCKTFLLLLFWRNQREKL